MHELTSFDLMSDRCPPTVRDVVLFVGGVAVIAGLVLACWALGIELDDEPECEVCGG
jgi:hypothetical protein